MFQLLPTLQKLIRQLQKIPYLATKNVYRVAIYFLTTDDKAVQQLCQTIMDAKKAIKPCELCFNWTETSKYCTICSSTQRNKDVICVVETWHDLHAIEKTGEYKGLYHVLGGSLCPLEGIGPENLYIDGLLKRLDNSIKEVIFATNPTPEGEATASFISSKIDNVAIKFSRLASGVPTGSSLEYMDRITIAKALSGRRPF